MIVLHSGSIGYKEAEIPESRNPASITNLLDNSSPIGFYSGQQLLDQEGIIYGFGRALELLSAGFDFHFNVDQDFNWTIIADQVGNPGLQLEVGTLNETQNQFSELRVYQHIDPGRLHQLLQSFPEPRSAVVGLGRFGVVAETANGFVWKKSDRVNCRVNVNTSPDAVRRNVRALMTKLGAPVYPNSIHDSDLETMVALLAVDIDSGAEPFYLNSIYQTTRILQEAIFLPLNITCRG